MVIFDRLIVLCPSCITGEPVTTIVRLAVSKTAFSPVTHRFGNPSSLSLETRSTRTCPLAPAVLTSRKCLQRSKSDPL
jgi:hypothetical protein